MMNIILRSMVILISFAPPGQLGRSGLSVAACCARPKAESVSSYEVPAITHLDVPHGEGNW